MLFHSHHSLLGLGFHGRVNLLPISDLIRLPSAGKFFNTSIAKSPLPSDLGTSFWLNTKDKLKES